MRRRDLSNCDLTRNGKYYRKLFRWNSDHEPFFDECEFLYDRDGRLMGVDYRRKSAPILRPVP